MLTVGSLFSGIGGLDLGLERAGMRVRWQVEIDPYCQAVLRRHWPDVARFGDVRSLGADQLESVDVIAGGFPCQPFSVAGRRRGAADDRWLWPEFARLLRLLRPRYALLENVPGLLAGGGMAEVLGDLAALGFDAEWECIPAAAVGAPHLRYRIFIVANTDESGLEGRQLQPERTDQRAVGARGVADAEEFTERPGLREAFSRGIWRRRSGDGDGWPAEPDVGRVADGVPSRVDRLRALGNAVVPQVAEAVGRMIVEHAEE